MKLVLALIFVTGATTAQAMTAEERATGVERACQLTGKVVMSGESCSSSFWCGFNEHCVDGKCVDKDLFNQCDLFHSCSLGDECVDGVCK